MADHICNILQELLLLCDRKSDKTFKRPKAEYYTTPLELRELQMIKEMCMVWDVALRGIQTILPKSLYIYAHEGLVPVNRMKARLC